MNHRFKRTTLATLIGAALALPGAAVHAQDQDRGARQQQQQSQQHSQQQNRQQSARSLQNWDSQRLYRNTWSAEELLDAEVRGRNGEEIGEVKDLIVKRDGTIDKVIVEVGGMLEIGDQHIGVPWKDVQLGRDLEWIQVPLREVENGTYSLYGRIPQGENVSSGPNTWRVGELIGDYASLRDISRYGIVTDLIFDEQGKAQAVVVNREAGNWGRPGRYAHPFAGYGGDAGAYPLPHNAADVADLQPFDYKRLADESRHASAQSRQAQRQMAHERRLERQQVAQRRTDERFSETSRQQSTRWERQTAGRLTVDELVNQRVYIEGGQRLGRIQAIVQDGNDRGFLVVSLSDGSRKVLAPFDHLAWRDGRYVLVEVDKQNLRTYREDARDFDRLTRDHVVQVAGYTQDRSTGTPERSEWTARGADDASSNYRGAEVVVQRTAPQVNVEQAEPRITVHQPQPQVTVQQPQPQIIVRQPPPTITVDQRQPEIIVRMPEPSVDVQMAQPQVDVQVPQPRVRLADPRDQTASTSIEAAEPQVRVVPSDREPDISVSGAQPRVQFERTGEPDIVYNEPQGRPNIRFERVEQSSQQTADTDASRRDAGRHGAHRSEAEQVSARTR